MDIPRRKPQMRQQKRNTNLGMLSNAESHKVKFEAPNMEEGHNAVELALQRYSIFCHQDPETGSFDVTFLFNEKPLHAHSFILWSASEVFEAMILGPMAKKAPIPITAHSFEDFKEFLTFFYLGKCTITMDNVMGIVDLAESYNVQLLKDKCDEYLTNMTPTAENVFKICETLKIYSLQNALNNIYEFIAINAATLLKTQSFFDTNKDVVLDIVKMDRLVIKEEDLFDTIYKWAEYQHGKQETENPLSLKEYLSDVLPYIRFPIMNIDFLHSNVVPLGYLFSSFNELSQILQDAASFQKKTLTRPASKYPHTVRKSFNVIISDNRGNAAHTYIHDASFIECVAKHTQNYRSSGSSRCSYYDVHGKECIWDIPISKPTNKNIFDLNSCKLYIIRNQQGMLSLKDFSTSESSAARGNNPPRGLHPSDRRLVNLNMIEQWHAPPSLRRNISQNLKRNDQNNTDECEIVARVYPENNNFIIGQGCTLKVVQSTNGNTSQRDDIPYDEFEEDVLPPERW